MIKTEQEYYNALSRIEELLQNPESINNTDLKNLIFFQIWWLIIMRGIFLFAPLIKTK